MGVGKRVGVSVGKGVDVGVGVGWGWVGGWVRDGGWWHSRRPLLLLGASVDLRSQSGLPGQQTR